KSDTAAEIISADSMQVYRHMDIGSAKPSSELRSRLPHHLIDIRNPNEQFHAADFVTLAELLIDDIAGSGKIPVVSGGTAFYFRTLLYGLPGTPSGNPGVRATILEREAINGLEGLYRDLTVVDPDSARRISSNDRYRISRALEVYYTSGTPLSRFLVPSVPRSDLQVLILGLNRPREQLYTRIDARVNLMFQTGLCSEVEKLVRSGYLPHDPGFRGIGYREFFERYREASSENDPADSDRFADWVASLDDSNATAIKEKIKTNSRHYAKRQTTFFKRLPEVKWVDPDASQAIADRIGRFWEN
ncbi:MAG TPA: tRNA (adenosine(37)-N6)-dimethylallyltransferase MiaA, partial [Spirochaetia bacterium]|nr:tRNA (adenosine(37)-N6)-dimethylallyltransferase MiaA [Spirochaetia bacterium]